MMLTCSCNPPLWKDRGIVVIVEGRTDKRYFSRLSDALPRSCEVNAATREDLETFLAEVGIAGVVVGDRR